MGAMLSSLSRLRSAERAVLVRNGVVIRGTVFEVAAVAGHDAYWMLRGEKRNMAIALREDDTLYVSSKSPCFACGGVPGVAIFKGNCSHCFDRYL